MSEDGVSKKLFTCEGKGGTYELMGYADYGVYVAPSYVHLGTAYGAGKSRGNQLFIFRDKDGELCYTTEEMVCRLPTDKKPVYKDVETGLMYYREPDDFNSRMLPVAE